MGEDEENFRLKEKICCYFVIRKKRYCKMLVSQGQRYCGQHLVNETSTNIRGFRRIPCPLDIKHSCYEHKLDQHLKICNAKERSDVPYFLKGINQGELEQNVKQLQLNDLSNSELLIIIRKIEKCYEDHVKVNCLIRSHKLLEEYILKSDFGSSANRHLKQNSSILGHLEEKSLLNNATQGPTAYIEFGSGKGQLTSWVIQGVKNKDNSTFLLIDKGAQRYKFDAKLRYNKELKIIRLRIDIQDLNLRKVEGLEEDSTVVGYGKHLCGAATDFSLRCLTQSTTYKVGGIVIALCCHHRCTWQSYTGKEFLKNLGFAPEDFSILISLSSWAVSSSRKLKTENEVDEEDHSALISEENLGTNLDIKENRYTALGLTVEAREELGRKVKQLLDTGRVEYLSKHGFQSNLVEYVSKSETLENIALVAHPMSSVAIDDVAL